MSSDEYVWTRLWTPLSKDGLSGWVSTLTAAEAVREAFELNKSVFFVSRYKAAMFGHQTDSKSVVDNCVIQCEAFLNRFV
jgi:hypothetical protein